MSLKHLPGPKTLRQNDPERHMVVELKFEFTLSGFEQMKFKGVLAELHQALAKDPELQLAWTQCIAREEVGHYYEKDLYESALNHLQRLRRLILVKLIVKAFPPARHEALFKKVESFDTELWLECVDQTRSVAQLLTRFDGLESVEWTEPGPIDELIQKAKLPKSKLLDELLADPGE
jgi:hypothetical protein